MLAFGPFQVFQVLLRVASSLTTVNQEKEVQEGFLELAIDLQRFCKSPKQWFSKCGPQTSSFTWELLKNANLGNSLAVQWLGLRAFTAEGLVAELRSCKPCGVAKKKKANLICIY